MQNPTSFLHRIAAARPGQDDDAGLSRAQMGAMGVAAAAPFAGLIGEQPIIHDPLQGAQGKTFKNLEAVERAARPGDVLLMSKSKGSLFKDFITPAGRSQFYHAQPVTGRAEGKGYTLSAGDLHGQGLKAREALDHDYSITDYMRDPDAPYHDVVLLRPKQKLTPEQLEALREDYGKRVIRPYDDRKAADTFLRDLFIPKLDVFNAGRPETVCQGNVCSTLPAQSFHTATGNSVIPGKRAQDVFPTDFLRSDQFEMIGSHVTPETRALEQSVFRKASPWLMRGGIGATLAAGTYGVSEDPALGAGLLGAAATDFYLDNMLKNKNLDPRIKEYVNAKNFPTFWDAGTDIMEGGLKTPAGKARLGRFMTRRIPALAAGGALAYGGAKALGAGYDALRERYADRSE